MNTLTLKANVYTEKTIEIPVPFFSRRTDEREYIALLDAETVVKMYIGDFHTSISNSKRDSMESTKLIEAWEQWHSCTESEFLEKYDAVIESISLHPKLAV